MMLSAIGRTAIQRLGARVSYTAPKLQRVILITSASTASTRDQFLQLRSRGYATAAAASATKAKKPSSTKATVTRKPRATTKKPAKKTKAAAKKPAKKAAKKPVKKAPKKRVKKPLTDKQKAAKAALDKRTHLKEIKAKALVAEEPKQAGDLNVFGIIRAEAFEALKKANSKPLDQAGVKSSFKNAMAQAQERYSNLSASELEHYNQIVTKNKAQFESSYKAWVNGYTAEEIRQANSARTTLRKLTGKSRMHVAIHDERSVERPKSAYILFTRDRWSSGDFKGVGMREGALLIADEWKKLSSAEAKHYTDIQVADRERYIREYKSVYGHEHPKMAKAATAA